jgi:hypothetical protein
MAANIQGALTPCQRKALVKTRKSVEHLARSIDDSERAAGADASYTHVHQSGRHKTGSDMRMGQSQLSSASRHSKRRETGASAAAADSKQGTSCPIASAKESLSVHRLAQQRSASNILQSASGNSSSLQGQEAASTALTSIQTTGYPQQHMLEVLPLVGKTIRKPLPLKAQQAQRYSLHSASYPSPAGKTERNFLADLDAMLSPTQVLLHLNGVSFVWSLIAACVIT